MMDITAFKELLSELIIPQHCIITLLGKVQATDSNNDIFPGMIYVDQVRRGPAYSMFIADMFYHTLYIDLVAARRCPFRVFKVIFIDSKHKAAHSRDRFKLERFGLPPSLAVLST
jgi:hypothetical protein